MVILGPRSDFGKDVEEAAARAPYLWAHRRAMLWWQKMNALDAEAAKGVIAPLKGCKKEWFYSIPLGVATVLSQTQPELFFDTTGTAMKKFLRTEAGRPYRVPGNKVVPV